MTSHDEQCIRRAHAYGFVHTAAAMAAFATMPTLDELRRSCGRVLTAAIELSGATGANTSDKSVGVRAIKNPSARPAPETNYGPACAGVRSTKRLDLGGGGETAPAIGQGDEFAGHRTDEAPMSAQQPAPVQTRENGADECPVAPAVL